MNDEATPFFLHGKLFKLMFRLSRLTEESKMSRRLIFLLTLCSISTSGYVIGRPTEKCPVIAPYDIRCTPKPQEDTCSNDGDCQWKEKCCSNGCRKRCIVLSEGIPPWPKHPPGFDPIPPRVKPYDPFREPPFYPFPEPPFKPLPKPDLPPIYFPPNPGYYDPEYDIRPSFNDFP